MPKKFKSVSKILSFILIFVLGYMYVEPVVADAAGATVQQTFTVTQTVTGELSMTDPADVALSPDLGGMTGGTSTGSTSFSVTTSNEAGFTTTVQSSDQLSHTTLTDYFKDYTQAAPTYNWTNPADSAFGYNVVSSVAATAFKNNGTSACGSGANNSIDHCWIGFSTSTPYTILTTSSAQKSGVTATINLKAYLAANQNFSNGSYTTTITVTSTCN
jgi:hypothetical protein